MTIVMPGSVSPGKQEAAAAYGAPGDPERSMPRREHRACQEPCWCRGDGVFIHPFDNETVIAGQGTIGLWILEESSGCRSDYRPCGGGGLIAGIASGQGQSPRYQGHRGAGLRMPVGSRCPEIRKAHDGEVPPDYCRWRPCQSHGRPHLAGPPRSGGDVVLVDEGQMVPAISLLLERKKTLAEGAGAAPLAASWGAAFLGPGMKMLSSSPEEI